MKKGTVTRWKRPLAAALGALFVLSAVCGMGVGVLPDGVRDALPDAVRETVNPITVQAAGNDPAMVMGTDAVLGQNDDYNSTKANTQVVWYNGKSWYVIGYKGNGAAALSGNMTLFATDNIINNQTFHSSSNQYSGSNLKTQVESIANGFTNGEKAAITPKELTGGSGNYGSTSPPLYNHDHIAGSGVSNALLWPLSVKEAKEITQQELCEASAVWWLRSPGHLDDRAAIAFGDVLANGLVVYNGIFGVRPAFNINLSFVLFTSAAVGGKVSGGLGTLKKIEPMSIVSTAAPNEWKLTLKDDSTVAGLDGHTGFDASRTGGAADPVQPGDQIMITYSGAKTEANEYVSVILKDGSGNILYYGNLANSSAGGTDVPLTIPADVPAGNYILGVFAEQCNGNNQTDYASAVKDISLTVAGITTNSLPAGTAGTAYNQTLTTNIPASVTLAWSTTGGTLPPGLSLDPSTGAITGTPTTAGTYPFTVRVTGGSYDVTKDLSIIIAPAPTPTPAPTPSGGSGSNVYSIWYEVIKGHGQTWVKGSGVPLAFTAKRSAEDDKTFSLFRGVEIDGATLDQAHYTATAGSVNLSLSAVYLETLSEGTHTIRILFTDGHAEGQFTVLSAAAPANMTRVTPPQTSDANVPVLYGFGALLLIAIAGLCAGVWRGKRAR